MADQWTQRWNERYSSGQYAYGEEPNLYFKEQIDKLKPGSILLPAEGEGRNAVYAATLGWKVSAVDISEAGKDKALQLAKRYSVSIDYRVAGLEELDYKAGEFDAIALIYAHFPATIKSAYHKALDKFLKPGGIIIFEAFSKKHLDYLAKDPQMGGPKDIESLFSKEEIRADFPNYDILELKETEIELREGKYHQGKGSVIRFTGRKL